MSSTPNPQRGEVEIILSGQPRIIRLTTNSIARAEKIIDKSLLSREVVLSWLAITALIFTALNDPTLTLEQVGDQIDDSDKNHVMAKVFESWALHLGRGAKVTEVVKPADPTKASPGPGTNS
jgi:hypothetical protein